MCLCCVKLQVLFQLAGCTRHSRIENTFTCWWRLLLVGNSGPSLETEVRVFFVWNSKDTAYIYKPYESLIQSIFRLVRRLDNSFLCCLCCQCSGISPQQGNHLQVSRNFFFWLCSPITKILKTCSIFQRPQTWKPAAW